jgi:hypothetical protein
MIVILNAVVGAGLALPGTKHKQKGAASGAPTPSFRDENELRHPARTLNIPATGIFMNNAGR